MLDSINIDSSVAVYVQIENEVQFAITSGRLKPGDRLPPLREMSERLGLNANTVVRAYRDLEVMGLVYSRRGMGVFVADGVTDRCARSCREQVIRRLHESVGEAKSAGMTTKKIREIVEACEVSETGPYGAVPASVLSLADSKNW